MVRIEKFLWWKCRSRVPPLIPKKATRLSGWGGRSGRFELWNDGGERERVEFATFI
jgi:hypothetical protein